MVKPTVEFGKKAKNKIKDAKIGEKITHAGKVVADKTKSAAKAVWEKSKEVTVRIEDINEYRLKEEKKLRAQLKLRGMD